MKLRKSPFKVDRIENDPKAYALRRREIVDSSEALYNNRNILISGTRGIGKSSLASQMQILYQKNNTLLTRCKIETQFPEYLCAFYACDENSNLSSLAFDILYRIEQECLFIKTYEPGGKKELKLELDLSVIKASLKSDLYTKTPASIVTSYVSGLKMIYKSLTKFTKYKGINVFIDEVDRLSKNINFGHFIKLIHEYSMNDDLENITYIYAGQIGVYNRLLIEDASIDRLLKHIPISKIDVDESRHILEYASVNANSPFSIMHDAEDMILKISAGYPYVIHLLGNEAYSNMNDERLMTIEDVAAGLRGILMSDKGEKYLNYLCSLNKDERIVISSLAIYRSRELPMKIGHEWLENNLLATLSDGSSLDSILNTLHKAGYIIFNRRDNIIQFNDELFRIYLSVRRMEDAETDYLQTKEWTLEEIVKFTQEAELDEIWEHDKYHEVIDF